MSNRTLIIVVSILIAFFVTLSLLPKRIIANYPSSGRDIIAFGDSLVVGYGAREGGDFVTLLSNKIQIPIINLGKKGDTTADAILRLGEIDAYNPKVVMILLGGNDFLKKVPIEITRANLEQIIQYIQSKKAVVVLLGVRGGVLKDGFSSMYEDLSQKYNTAYVPDVLKGLVFNTNYMYDAVHPNDAGYRLIAEKIYPVIKKFVY